ncbi:MAG: septal ring lytic transglycosylase RlpA family protein [Hyphomicrobiales bacterium]|nr:septal ring lytic transglycosylase RlpA family protein [Hyphomicrobiales bacterium]
MLKRAVVMIALALSMHLATNGRTAHASGAYDQQRAAVRGWRTVVIPAARDAKDWTTRITTAALPKGAPAPRTGPLVGVAHKLDGIASFYWQGQMTASGERFDPTKLTAAHPTLPMGTLVRVTHLASGRSVQVRINDRGPFKPGRVIDLSLAAAEHLDMTRQGLARVRVDVLAGARR